MRSFLPVAALLTLFVAPLHAGQAEGEDACQSQASQRLGVASAGVGVLSSVPAVNGYVVSLDIAGQVATCVVTEAGEVLEITMGDSRSPTLAHNWQTGCVALAAQMQGVAESQVAVGQLVGGQADILVLGGRSMSCEVADDGSVLAVNFR